MNRWDIFNWDLERRFSAMDQLITTVEKHQHLMAEITAEQSRRLTFDLALVMGGVLSMACLLIALIMFIYLLKWQKSLEERELDIMEFVHDAMQKSKNENDQ